MEEIMSQLSLLNSSMSNISKRFEGIDKRIDKIDGKLVVIGRRFLHNENQNQNVLQHMNRRISSIERVIDENEINFRSIERRMTSLENPITHRQGVAISTLRDHQLRTSQIFSVDVGYDHEPFDFFDVRGIDETQFHTGEWSILCVIYQAASS